MAEDDIPVTPDLVLQAYCAGYFPMARSERGRKLYWFDPDTRGILPLEHPNAFHVPRSLKKFLRNCMFDITVNADFESVITACAKTRNASRDDTWINPQIISLYTELHRMGYAHSVEVWSKSQHASDSALIGGLYGISIEGAFFGESMFSRRTNASKAALVHLVKRLNAAGYSLLDAQFENDHLTQFGFCSVPRSDYRTRLRHALSISPNPSSRFLTVSVSKF
ncbi:MAG: leucyl/phenylalanyl-tRNA--protein transferase [Alphaproteobacteria bacterium]|nr:leucyl/phenylalanyl-tRNA--protein transferase [Alphaproteobacteria bacterium]